MPRRVPDASRLAAGAVVVRRLADRSGEEREVLGVTG
jgi:hypothetical protein